MNLRTKTIIGIAAIETVLLVILVLSAMSFLGDSNEKQLIQRAHATTTMFSHAVKDAVLTTNLATLDDLVHDIMELEDVLYVRIESYGQTLSEGGDIQLLNKVTKVDKDLSSITDGVFDTNINIESNGDVYGSIKIGFATGAISEMLDQARKSIIGIASLEVLLVALFSFVLGTYLTRNLVKLRKAAYTVSQKGPGYQINLKQNDELGEVADAFDAMSKNLAESYNELQTARKQAEQASESKSLFLASMSHEIRTPMNGVIGLLDTLDKTSLNKEQKQLVSTATESGHLLLSLINNILDFSKMEANNMTIDRQAFHVVKATQSVMNSVMPIAESKMLTLSLTVNTLPDYLVGDENRYKQVLLNLIGNALKFTESGTIEVILDSTEIADQNAMIHGKVIDSGVGIKADAIPYLFDEFTMADQTFSRSYEGSGLGLAICKKLLNLMDGEISVQSKEGEGSCFTFRIPMAVATENTTSDCDLQTSQPQELHPTCKSARILVAEDNKANQLVILNIFKHLGIDSIDIANNGIEAVKMAVSNRYDIIFMDISMPEMDGLQACAAIRQSEDQQLHSLPVIACTAHALSGDKERFISAGMTDYVSKPINLSQLVSMLNKYIALQTEINPQQTYSNAVTEQPKDPDSSNENSAPLVNEAILIQMVKDTSADVMPMLIEHYVDEARQHISKMVTALQQQEMETLKFEAHTLGSASAALGNTALAKLATEIETLCINNQFAEVMVIGTSLEETANRSLEALLLRKEQGFEEALSL